MTTSEVCDHVPHQPHTRHPHRSPSRSRPARDGDGTPAATAAMLPGQRVPRAGEGAPPLLRDAALALVLIKHPSIG